MKNRWLSLRQPPAEEGVALSNAHISVFSINYIH